jgi:hypothetical protein
MIYIIFRIWIVVGVITVFLGMGQYDSLTFAIGCGIVASCVLLFDSQKDYDTIEQMEKEMWVEYHRNRDELHKLKIQEHKEEQIRLQESMRYLPASRFRF